ncbi:hypothetical protein FB446DRAFT_709416 [Lentinula raphanica]|nr:hypothetical protein FB446DRAFT_709416 [Lentinula raphanica]
MPGRQITLLSSLSPSKNNFNDTRLCHSYSTGSTTRYTGVLRPHKEMDTLPQKKAQKKEPANLQSINSTNQNSTSINKDKGPGNKSTVAAADAESANTPGAGLSVGDALTDLLPQPRRSGRKTSAPTIIQPLTSQNMAKPKRTRNTASMEATQGDNAGLELQGEPKEAGTARSNKGKKLKGTKIMVQPLPLQAHQRSPVADPPPPTPTRLIHEADPVPGDTDGLVSGDDDPEDFGMVGEEEALQILTTRKEALRRPLSPLDAAYSDEEEQRHLARAKAISATRPPGPLESGFPPLSVSRPGFGTPACGRFPWVSGFNAETFGKGQDPEQVKEWLKEAIEHPDKNFVLVWYADESHLTPSQRRAIARHLIAGRTNLPKDEVRTSPPNPILRADGSVQGAPKYDLLRGAVADAAANILSSDGQSVIAEGGKAVFLSNFPPINDHFLALIEGLTFLDNEEEAAECEVFIRTALANHSKIKQLIVSKAPATNPPVAPDVVYRNWLDTLTVTSLVIGRSGTKPNPEDIEPEEPLYDIGWRLYGRPFTVSVPHQKKLQHLLSSLHLSHPYMGRAEFKTQPYKCGICRGVDHPIGLCPFPELDEWFGPTLQTICENDACIRRQTGRGRARGHGGFRGRARGGRGCGY